MKELKDRNFGIDIVKIIAVILVLCLHFFLYTNYYDAAKDGVGMKLQTVIRNFCMICVPLFLLATGYLNKKTEYNKNFFKSLFNILIVWLIYCFVEYFVFHESYGGLSLKNIIFTITSFKVGYSWYIEMYIGLYLLAPIINNAYNSLDKKNRFRLLLVVIAVISLPEFVNAIFDGCIHVPSWWSYIYPFSYYIVGKYLSDVNPKVNKKLVLILLTIMQLFIYSYSYLRIIGFESFLTLINAMLIFLLFYDISIKSSKLQKAIQYISSITLDIYLASSLVDKFIYPLFNKKMLSLNISQSKIILFSPLVILVIFLLSLIYSTARKFIIRVR